MTTVADAIAILDRAYPPHLAESWDKVGLICGDPADPADTILLALDCTQEVADAAVAAGADMLVVHHPLLLRGVTSVAANTPKGKIIHTLIRNGVALFAAHTNADSARPGVNDQLAHLVGITPGRPIKPIRRGLDKWGVQVPVDQAPALKSALFAAGAGNIGEYSECAFAWEGAGQFRPSTSAQPAIGNRDELTKVTELRIEFVAPSRLREAIMGALRTAHPYEEPAFDVVATEPTQPLRKPMGWGASGTCRTPCDSPTLCSRSPTLCPSLSGGFVPPATPTKWCKQSPSAPGLATASSMPWPAWEWTCMLPLTCVTTRPTNICAAAGPC